MTFELDLRGQRALVTGASGELGRAMARSLATAGASLALHYFRGAERAQVLADELSASGVEVVTVGGDVTAFEQVKSMRAELASRWGEPSIVVANAVIQYEWLSVLEQPLADFASQHASTTMQLVHLAKVFAPAMLSAKWGRFVVINTECAVQCAPSQGAYATAKRGLDGLCRVLARELGPSGITVNQVAPGWTIGDASRREGTERQPDYEAGVPLRRRGTDQDVANAVTFLASQRAAFITGAFLPVCGGNVMPGL